MIASDHLILPDNATYSYLAEGAANIVYKICPVPEESEVNIHQHAGEESVPILHPKLFKSKQDSR